MNCVWINTWTRISSFQISIYFVFFRSGFSRSETIDYTESIFIVNLKSKFLLIYFWFVLLHNFRSETTDYTELILFVNCEIKILYLFLFSPASFFSKRNYWLYRVDFICQLPNETFLNILFPFVRGKYRFSTSDLFLSSEVENFFTFSNLIVDQSILLLHQSRHLSLFCI